MKHLAILFALSVFAYFGWSAKAYSENSPGLNESKTKHHVESDCSEKESYLSRAESLIGDFDTAVKRLEMEKVVLPDYSSPRAVLNRDSSEQVKDAQELALGIYANIEVAKELVLNRKEKKRVERIESKLKANKSGLRIYQATVAYYSKHTDIFSRGNRAKIKSFLDGKRNYLKGVDSVKPNHN